MTSSPLLFVTLSAVLFFSATHFLNLQRKWIGLDPRNRKTRSDFRAIILFHFARQKRAKKEGDLKTRGRISVTLCFSVTALLFVSYLV